MTASRPDLADQPEIRSLVGAAATGDEGAWNALVDRFSPLVYAIVRGFRIDPADAADVNQTVWLRLVENLGRLREPEHVGAWLATTTRNECLRALRLASRQVPTDDEAVFDRPDPDERTDRLLLLSERDAALWRAFEELPERCRHLLRVVIADPPPSYEEVAAAVGLSVGSVGPTRARCLKQLRQSAELAGIDPELGDSL
jgi:RNA polymerase sigma factor (sigma-70 family)